MTRIWQSAVRNPAKVAHLAFHLMLRFDTPSDVMRHGELAWVQCGLDEINRSVLAAAIARSAVDGQLPVPYSPHYEGVYLEKGTLRYERGAPGEGLTCATYMLEVFDALGFELVLRDTWPVREQEDREWVEWIISELEKNAHCTPEHIQAIRDHPIGVRFRPEEVAGAVASERPPLDFKTAVEAGADLRRQLAPSPEDDPDQRCMIWTWVMQKAYP